MSKLGKTLLWAALVGAIVAVGAGVALVFQYNDTKTTLADTQQAKAAAEKAATKAKEDAAASALAKTDVNTKLTAANSKIDDLNTQLSAAQKASSDAATAAQTATENAKAAQDKLDAINKTLNGETPEQYIADKTKAESDLAAAQAEQKIIQDQLQASQTQISDLQDALKRSKTGTQPPGISGKVTFVDHAWNFVILDVGLSNGVVPNGELIVYRGR